MQQMGSITPKRGEAQPPRQYGISSPWSAHLLVEQHARQQGKGVIGEEGIGFGIAGEEN
ncbi:hypothetical protein BANT918_02230 [Brevibacterium antiquum CNRZ 918]|uniref:Uncharacterized protein n=1 Tax=Brevibacterium antiquum CNRZ 918 TaxID=1255637 RepID=A0A2H1K9U2_9MICO|nr:hypothetical protein BANT918_02230 [Brevibacterium antiquum CNRZ 918]